VAKLRLLRKCLISRQSTLRLNEYHSCLVIACSQNRDPLYTAFAPALSAQNASLATRSSSLCVSDMHRARGLCLSSCFNLPSQSLLVFSNSSGSYLSVPHPDLWYNLCNDLQRLISSRSVDTLCSHDSRLICATANVGSVGKRMAPGTMFCKQTGFSII
jgi:hypothetical protein